MAEQSTAGILAQVMSSSDPGDPKWSIYRNHVVLSLVESSPKLPHHSLMAVIHGIFSSTSIGCVKLPEFLDNSIKIWSSQAFLRNAAEDRHEYISRAILYCLQLYNEGSTALSSSANFSQMLSMILQGVQNHLAVPTPQTRRWGMVVLTSVSLSWLKFFILTYLSYNR